MARRAKATEAKSNLVDPQVVNDILDRWDVIQTERLSDQGAYRAKCKEHKGSEDRLLKEAKARGICPKLLKKDIRKRKLAAQMQEIADTIEDGDLPIWEAIELATSERDAGPSAAASRKAQDAEGNADALDDLMGDDDE